MTQKQVSKNYKKVSYKLMSIAILSTIVISSLFLTLNNKVEAQSFSSINRQLELGDKGIEVTNLQTFLAANPEIYPSGLVTGYFGPLTKAAVIKYQASNGISQVGRVGPLTLARINSQISSGGWSQIDIDAPLFSNVHQSMNQNNITFTFNTNEATTAYVAYSTSPLTFNEGDINSVGFAVLNGNQVNSSSGLNNSHVINVPNLNRSTTYYYTLVVKDKAGNISVWGVNNTFTTTQ